MRCPLLEHSGKSLLTLLECETSPILLTECVELHLSLCSLQVLWVLQKPNGADAWALWKLPSLWLSVWTNRISHGLQPFLWEILRLGWLFWSSDRSESPSRKNLVRIGRRKEGHLPWDLLPLSPLPAETQRQWLFHLSGLLAFIRNVYFLLSSVVFSVPLGMVEKTLCYLLPL